MMTQLTLIHIFGLIMLVASLPAQSASKDWLKDTLGRVLETQTTEQTNEQNVELYTNLPLPPPSPLDRLGSDDMKVGVLRGALWGGLAGVAYTVLKDDEDDAAKNILVGASAGAISGVIAGSIAKSRREYYETETAYLNAEIESANRAIDVRSQEIAEYEQAIEESRQEVANLEERYNNNKRVKRKAKKEFEKLEKTIAANEVVLAQMQKSIGYLDDTLEVSRLEAAETKAEKEELLALQSDLSDRKEEISNRYQRLHKANDEGKMLAARLRPMTGQT